MINDTSPEVLFCTYGKPEKLNKLFEELKKKQLMTREVKFFAVNIPLDEKYDDTINWFKHFIMSGYWVDKNPFLKDNFIINQISKHLPAGYKPIKWDCWDNDYKHDFLLTGLCPLFVQDKTEYCVTKTEQENMKKLFKFESDNYKPNKTGVKKPEEMQIIKENEI